MTRNGRVPGTSARTMSSDCWGKWSSLVSVATKSSSSVSRSTWPPNSWHEESSSSPLLFFVFICMESSEKPHSSGGGLFQGWLVVSPMRCLWDEGLVFLFSLLVASISMAGCSGEVWAWGRAAPGAGRGGCSRSAGPFRGASSPCCSHGKGGSFHQYGYHSSAHADEGAWRNSSTQTPWKFHRSRNLCALSSSFQLWNIQKLEIFCFQYSRRL